MARPRRRLWKRPYTSFRLGDRRRPDVDDELQRLTLYLPGRLLDLAEKLTIRDGRGSIQAFCESLLTRALEVEQSRHQLEDAEARYGPLEGLRAIADDPEYLAEWTASSAHRAPPEPPPVPAEEPAPLALSRTEMLMLPVEPSRSSSAETILRHADLDGAGHQGFLPSVRRGEVPPVRHVEELAAALVDLDDELAGSPTIDRRLAHALHRLALEAQVLHTDAWPNAFDSWTIDAIRAVQAAVERILSGETGAYR